MHATQVFARYAPSWRTAAARQGGAPRQASGDRLVRLAVTRAWPRHPCGCWKQALAEDLDRGTRASPGPSCHGARGGVDQWHGRPCGRSRRQLSRCDVPPGCRDHRRGTGCRRRHAASTAAIPARRRARLRGIDPHRRGNGPAALQVLAQHRHGGHLRCCRSGRQPAASGRGAFAHALATAATFAAGLQQAFRMDSMSKPLHAGRAAEAGVLAASSRPTGMTGSLDVLDGEAGLGRAMATGPTGRRSAPRWARTSTSRG